MCGKYLERLYLLDGLALHISHLIFYSRQFGKTFERDEINKCVSRREKLKKVNFQLAQSQMNKVEWMMRVCCVCVNVFLFSFYWIWCALEKINICCVKVKSCSTHDNNETTAPSRRRKKKWRRVQTSFLCFLRCAVTHAYTHNQPMNHLPTCSRLIWISLQTLHSKKCSCLSQSEANVMTITLIISFIGWL